jgi:capsular polysaccharide biosynthesis protein
VEQGNENNTVCTVVCIQEICCQRKGKNHQEFSDEAAAFLHALQSQEAQQQRDHDALVLPGETVVKGQVEG